MTTALDETLFPLGTPKTIFRRDPSINYRKPLKLPRPCFPMARQCVKLRRTNPAHAEGNLFAPSQSLAFCLAQRLTWRACRHLGQNTACNTLPAHPPLSKTASFVQEAGGPRQRMGEEVCRIWYILFRKIMINGIRFRSACVHVLCSYFCCVVCAPCGLRQLFRGWSTRGDHLIPFVNI